MVAMLYQTRIQPLGARTMRRREFIALLGGAAAGWPRAARAQPRGRMRRIGVLMGTAASDSFGIARVGAFLQALQELNWSIGRNMQLETRWAAGNAGLFQKYAGELVALDPDVILANGTSAVGPLQQRSRTVPIVFVGVVDPVGGGLVASLAHPAGSATGFSLFEYNISSKWLELLKQIAPRMTRAAIIRDAGLTSGSGQLGALQGAAAAFGIELHSMDVRNTEEIEREIKEFARTPNGGLIATSSTAVTANRGAIVKLAAEYRLPAVYPFRVFADDGGLVAYGPEMIDPYRRAAGYVDRILKGEKPADLPVQAPTKYELVINLKTAKALGLDVPATVLARADEVIE